MPAYNPDGLPSSDDISCLFLVMLGRGPTAAELQENMALPMGQGITGFFRSAEFRALRDSVIRRRPLRDGPYESPLEGGLANWAAHFFPLAQSARDQVRSAGNWARLFEILFSDWRFRKRIAREWRGLSMRAFIAGLKAIQKPAVHIVGGVEAWSVTEVTGWAVDRHDPDRMLSVELYVDERFVAAGRTGMHRHDIGDRWGGRGLIAFAIRLPPAALAGNSGFAEVREATSGLTIGRFETRNLECPPVDAIAQIRAEIDSLRNVLDRIEGKLPAFNAALGYSLQSYDAYFRTYYAPIHRSVMPGMTSVDVDIVIDATEAAGIDLERSLASLARQSCVPRAITVLVDDGDLRLDMDLIVDAGRDRLDRRLALVTRVVAPDRRADAVNGVIVSALAGTILLMPASCCLTPDALEAFDAAIRGGAAIAYSDSDRLEGDPWALAPRHVDPRFRSGFDPTLILQQDMCGPVLAVRRDYVLAHPCRPIFDRAFCDDLLVGAAMTGIAVAHLPRILYHMGRSIEGMPPMDRAAIVRDHLGHFEPDVAVMRLDDALQAPTKDTLRVQWPIPAGTRATIIIPTRDRLDLLMPCLGSIESSMPANNVEVDVIIVNNRSDLPETKDFLARVGRSSGVRVLDYDGAFNWAGMNNRAAQETDADILIFLNNDTVALSPHCWDELCSQALRKEIGAVGARLLYEDGTVQHAGVVMDEWHSFASHEGVGDAANDAGYLERHVLVREVSTVTGACLATRADVFRQSGGFDAAVFPVEGNDSDYCLRLRSRGLKIIYDGQACLYHFESRSRGYNDDEAKRRRAFLATQALRERWAAQFEQDPYYNPHFDRLAPPFTRLQPPRPPTVRAGRQI